MANPTNTNGKKSLTEAEFKALLERADISQLAKLNEAAQQKQKEAETARASGIRASVEKLASDNGIDVPTLLREACAMFDLIVRTKGETPEGAKRAGRQLTDEGKARRAAIVAFHVENLARKAKGEAYKDSASACVEHVCASLNVKNPSDIGKILSTVNLLRTKVKKDYNGDWSKVATS
jgi:hypothetical protein